jgi:3-hydroxybutyryl-CoA dehydrogenase
LADISKIGVVACGLMGHGIAQVAAHAGYEVVAREVSQEKLDGGIGMIEKQLARAVDKGRMEKGDAEAVRGRITPTLEYGDLAESDLVIEAVTEDLGLKLEMWGELDKLVKPEAFFATNTSSLPVIDQAVATSRPKQSDEAFAVGMQFGAKLGKLTVETRDRAGFIVNRLLVPFLLDGMRAYEEGVGSIEQIDAAMKRAPATPWGR